MRTLSRTNINAFLILFLVNVFQSLDRKSFVESFVVMPCDGERSLQ